MVTSLILCAVLELKKDKIKDREKIMPYLDLYIIILLINNIIFKNEMTVCEILEGN